MSPRPRATLLLLFALLAFGAPFGCRDCGPRDTGERTIFFGDDVVGVVDESVAGSVVTRTLRKGDEQIVTRVVVDDAGFARDVDYVRPHKRHVRLQQRERRVLLDDDHGHSVDLSASYGDAADHVVVIDLVHRMRVTKPVRALLVDVSSAEALPVTVARRGPEITVVDDSGAVVVRAVPEGLRIGPGAFAEGDADATLRPAAPVALLVPGKKSVRGQRLGGAGKRVPPPSTFAPTPDLFAPGLFLESDAPEVKAFARCPSSFAGTGTLASPSPAPPSTEPAPGAVLEYARALSERVHPLVDAQKVDEPPSALQMLARGGDCDGAAALVVAALRACGLAARPVVGFKLEDAGQADARLVPHAVAEVYAGGNYVVVDATVPALAPTDVFLPVAAGLGSALSIGRVLGVVDGNDVVDNKGGL